MAIIIEDEVKVITEEFYVEVEPFMVLFKSSDAEWTTDDGIVFIQTDFDGFVLRHVDNLSPYGLESLAKWVT